LLVLVAALLAVSGGVITAAIREPAPRHWAPGTSRSAWPTEEQLAAAETPVHLAHLVAAAAPEALRVVRGRMELGDTLARALGRAGVSRGVVHVIDRTLRPQFDFRLARPGHRFRLTLDPEGRLLDFRYLVSELESYVVRRDGDDFIAARENAVLRSQVTRIAGVVTTSLHAAIVQLGERGQLANDFSEIFAWDIDFTRTVQSGDEFRILYERLYRHDDVQGEIYVRPGRILAAHYMGSGVDLSALYFEPEEGRGGYYRPDGSSVEGQFLRAPLRYSRITSRFSGARRHPILKVTRPHHGIDYAAPRGTPLWSVADGKVIYRGWAGGFGNLVKIRHANGYVSYYAHLSRFAQGLRVGRPVQQKQVIGYVGSTGLATGPHVCFRVTKDGRYVNPARIHTPAGPPVPVEVLARFQTERDVVLAELEAGPLVAVEEAL
jgi:murein DD-endopeptidase MepM/ murein hydrolase activator NlpD